MDIYLSCAVGKRDSKAAGHVKRKLHVNLILIRVSETIISNEEGALLEEARRESLVPLHQSLQVWLTMPTSNDRTPEHFCVLLDGNFFYLSDYSNIVRWILISTFIFFAQYDTTYLAGYLIVEWASRFLLSSLYRDEDLERYFLRVNCRDQTLSP